MRKFILAAVLLSAMVVCMSGQTIKALPAIEKITLDGKLTEDVWNKVPGSGHFKFPQSIKGKPTAQTEFKVLAI